MDPEELDYEGEWAAEDSWGHNLAVQSATITQLCNFFPEDHSFLTLLPINSCITA
jgi:hypothetical protein